MASDLDSTPHHENLSVILHHAGALSITNERIAIWVAFLGFLQQIAWLLWKFVNAGIAIHSLRVETECAWQSRGPPCFDQHQPFAAALQLASRDRVKMSRLMRPSPTADGARDP
jgi:hypothetical protein